MPPIPAPINHTVAKIMAVYARSQQFGDSTGVAMGDAVNPCDFSIWGKLRWISPPELSDGQKNSRLKTGIYWEERLLEDLENIGCDVYNKQRKVTLADGWLRGKLDGIATGIPEASSAEHIVECKSHKSETFKVLVKKKLELANPDHYGQCQLYMHSMQIDRCIYLAVCKDTDERYAERIKYDPVYCMRAEERVKRIVASDAPPAKSESFACSWCKVRDVCLNGAWPRNNCRTCIHIVFEPGGVNRCAKHSKELNYKDQQAGCSDHRFLPGIVPGGEQIDVDGDLIVYLMADGSKWIDGMREG